MNVIKKISSILPNKHKYQIILLLFMTLVLTLFEILSISSIPILITAVLSKDVAFLNYDILNNFINNLDIKTIAIIVNLEQLSTDFSTSSLSR